MGKFLACLFMFCKCFNDNSSDDLPVNQVALQDGGRPLLDRDTAREVRYFPSRSNLESPDPLNRDLKDQAMDERAPLTALLDDQSSSGISNALMHLEEMFDGEPFSPVVLPRIVSFASSESIDFASFRPIVYVDYPTMKKQLLELIIQGYQEDLVAWKESAIHGGLAKDGERSYSPYADITLESYVAFLRYVNRDRKLSASRKMSPEISSRAWFFGPIVPRVVSGNAQQDADKYEKACAEAMLQRLKFNDDFVKLVPSLPIALSSIAKAKIKNYLVDNVDCENWKSYWVRFAAEAMILSSSNCAMCACIDPKLLPQKEPIFSVTKCHAKYAGQQVYVAPPRRKY